MSEKQGKVEKASLSEIEERLQNRAAEQYETDSEAYKIWTIYNNELNRAEIYLREISTETPATGVAEVLKEAGKDSDIHMDLFDYHRPHVEVIMFTTENPNDHRSEIDAFVEYLRDHL